MIWHKYVPLVLRKAYKKREFVAFAKEGLRSSFCMAGSEIIAMVLGSRQNGRWHLSKRKRIACWHLDFLGSLDGRL